MKNFKRNLFIVGVLFVVSIASGFIYAKSRNVKGEEFIKEAEINNEIEEITTIGEEKTNEIEDIISVALVENQEEIVNEEIISNEIKEESKEIKSQNIDEVKSSNKPGSDTKTTKQVDNKATTSTNTQKDNKPTIPSTSNEAKQVETPVIENKKVEPQIEPNTIVKDPEPVKVEEPVKPVETKPIIKAPTREYKINTIYMDKLRNTIITEVTNNLEQLNKFGITSVDDYKIEETSSICTYNGGNRSGWTYENATAYNTFKNSILKGKSMKIYAVDEYQNGEYIQTLCYYGH